MKKAFYLLLVTLLLVGCGGGGGTSTSSNGIPSGDTGGGGGISEPVGIIRVVFTGSGPAASAPVLQDNVTLESGYSLAPELGFRVSVSKYVTDIILIGYTKVYEEGDVPTPIYRTVTTRTYFNSLDNTAPGEISLKVPVDTGYLIEVVSYDKDPKSISVTPPFQMIRYGYVDNVSVKEGANPIVLGPSPTGNGRPFSPIADNTILFSRTQTITGSFEYTMTVTYNSKVPLKDQFNFSDKLNGSGSFDFIDANIDNTLKKIGVPFTDNAPVVINVLPDGSSNDNVYFQGQFYINDSMLSNKEQGEKAWKNFRLNAPAPYNNDIYQKLLLPADVQITI
jgi:hypothetical protein